MLNRLPFVSIIIPTYNRDKFLAITIESMLKLSYPSHLYEIIISDNNSTDSTRGVVETSRSKTSIRIKYLLEKRQGVHFARNSAAKIAKGDILYFTDDDIIADTMMLDELVKVFELNPLIGCATGKVLPEFLSPPPKWVSRYLINWLLSLTKVDQNEEFIVSQNALELYSCHQAIRREVFFLSGGFNPENTSGIWVGDGENGLNLKIKNLGYCFAYTPKSVTYHMIPPERMTLKYLIKRFENEGYCNSYTDYRSHRRRDLIIPMMIRRNTIGFFMLFAKAFVKIMIGREPVRFLPAYLAHLHKRNRFDIKLLRNAEFRRFVEIDDWLNAEYYDYTEIVRSLS